MSESASFFERRYRRCFLAIVVFAGALYAALPPLVKTGSFNDDAIYVIRSTV